MIDITYLVAAIVEKSDVEIPQAAVNDTTIANALRIAFGVAGGIAVLIITISAFRYVVSQGDPQSTAKAKNAIIGAVIGLVVSILAVGIVTFVLGHI